MPEKRDKLIMHSLRMFGMICCEALAGFDTILLHISHPHGTFLKLNTVVWKGVSL